MRLGLQGFFPAWFVYPRLFTPGLQFYVGLSANLAVSKLYAAKRDCNKYNVQSPAHFPS